MELYYVEEGNDIQILLVEREGNICLVSEYLEEHELKEKGYNGKNLKEIVEEHINGNYPTEIIYHDSEEELDKEIKEIVNILGYKKL